MHCGPPATTLHDCHHKYISSKSLSHLTSLTTNLNFNVACTPLHCGKKDQSFSTSFTVSNLVQLSKKTHARRTQDSTYNDCPRTPLFNQAQLRSSPIRGSVDVRTLCVQPVMHVRSNALRYVPHHLQAHRGRMHDPTPTPIPHAHMVTQPARPHGSTHHLHASKEVVYQPRRHFASGNMAGHGIHASLRRKLEQRQRQRVGMLAALQFAPVASAAAAVHSFQMLCMPPVIMLVSELARRLTMPCSLATSSLTGSR